MPETLDDIDRELRRLAEAVGSLPSENLQRFVKALCKTGVDVNDQDHKLAVYALASAVLQGREALEIFLGMMGKLMEEGESGLQPGVILN